MSKAWVSLPSSWKLEDVQAGLNVVIAVLSTLGIFTLVRYCWLRAARRVARNKDVSLTSLLSLNTLGEALDAASLFGPKLLFSRYYSILCQCTLVVCFSITAIIAGPIARFSSRSGTIVRSEDVSGLLASRHHNSIGYAVVEWSLTYQRLDKAGYPLDRLVDYLPQNSVDWIYEPSQWANNSWSMDCQRTPKTPILLEASGNCSRLRDEIPAFEQAFPYDQWDTYSASHSGFYDQLASNKDILLFFTGVSERNYSGDEETSKSLSVMVSAFHIHNIPRNQNTTSNCQFGVGAAEYSSYTQIQCELNRKDDVDDYLNLAYPDVADFAHGDLPYALTLHYSARFVQESTTDSTITTIQPDELIRFYQTYTIVKDLQYPQPATRSLSVEVQVVQISSFFLAIAAFVALLITLGLAWYALITILHYKVMQGVPQSKLDWMVQSIQAEDRPLTDAGGGLQRQVTVQHAPLGPPVLKGKTQTFEAAVYGRSQTMARFSSDSMATMGYGGSPPMAQGLSPQFSKGGQTPLLSQHIVSGDG